MSLLLGCLGLDLIAPAVKADDWPQWLGPHRDGIWRETGILRKFPANGPTIRWRTPLSGGFTGPAVAGGKVYVMDRIRGDESNPGKERVLCLKEADGGILWKFEYDCPYKVSYAAGPRTTPLVNGNKVYTLGTEGNLLCLDTADGKLIWSHEFKKELKVQTPTWGFAAHPIIVDDKLICLARGEGSTAIAYNKDTGKEIWRALTAKEPGYAPPMLCEAGGQRQLILWHPEAINALDPNTGKTLWSQPFTARTGLSISTPRTNANRLFITCFYDGPIMLELDSTKDESGASRPRAKVLWRGKGQNEQKTDGLHSIISTPFFEGDYIYGVCSYGQLRCLKADTGERLWESFQATTGEKAARWANAFLIKNGDCFFIPNEKGDLIIARLTPKGYNELSRAHLLEGTNKEPGRAVVWSHPAFANRCVYMRNDKEIICASLAE